MNKNHFYIKTRRSAADLPGEYAFHIHVDAQEILPENITRTLMEAGLTYDLFDLDWHFFGKDGDPKKPFEHHAPAQHMTFATSSAARFEEMWEKIVGVIKGCQAKCYIEGELIVLDQPLPRKVFNKNEFERLLPVVDPAAATPFVYRSALDAKPRSLPAIITLRRLDPIKNGKRDRFRCGEIHVTLRDDVNPHLLELLCNLGLSAPAIPKLIEAEDGTLARNADGSFVTIRDITLTLQAVDMPLLMRVGNVIMTLIEAVGGVQDGSIKIEFATRFEVLNGVDYNSSVPPVLDTVTFREDFQHLDSSHLGSISADLAELTRQTHQRAKTSVHVDKAEQFNRVWERTLSKNK